MESDQNFFDACSRTVSSIFRQFSELKSTVDQQLPSAMDVPRNYIIPTEDEYIRGLLVTYWSLRNALLELVYDLKNRGASSPESFQSLFLPGYAGALVLLDAARFLRERFHHWPTLRRKLNEPEPSFGIPAGVYDQTQESWTNPSHIWQLFDAARYYREHQAKWNHHDSTKSVADLVAIIEVLSERLKMTWFDYSSYRFQFRLRQLGCFLKRNCLQSAMFQIQKAAGILAADKYLKWDHHPSLPTNIQQQLNPVLSPGDVLLVRKEYALTNYFLPGYWPHAAFYLGRPDQLQHLGVEKMLHLRDRWEKFQSCDAPLIGRVLEAMKDGVCIRSVSSPYRSDSILVLRPKISVDSLKQAIDRAFFHEGKDYDFSFDLHDQTAWFAPRSSTALDGLEGTTFPLSLRAGRLTLAAADLVGMARRGETFHAVAAYVPMQSQQLIPENQLKEVLDRWAT
ncbi:MAG: YiiX/YebB-like N1pC/P60 family cysteine hydrolase [Pirellulales bacterium]